MWKDARLNFLLMFYSSISASWCISAYMWLRCTLCALLPPWLQFSNLLLHTGSITFCKTQFYLGTTFSTHFWTPERPLLLASFASIWLVLVSPCELHGENIDGYWFSVISKRLLFFLPQLTDFFCMIWQFYALLVPLPTRTRVPFKGYEPSTEPRWNSSTNENAAPR